MARPKKMGLNYFSLDTDCFLDKKIKRTIACVGAKGFTVYIFLLCEIYRSGYWISWDEDLLLDIADSVRISRGLTMEILNCLINRGLFDKQLADSEKVLTSESIQRRYLAAKKAARSTIKIEGRYWLLKSEKTDTSSEVYPDDSFCGENHSYCGKNSDNYRKNDTKESKVKESKNTYLLTSGNQSENLSTVGAIPTFEEVAAYIQEIGGGVDAHKFYRTYTAQGWKTTKGKPVTDWKCAVRYWKNTEGNFKPKVKSKSESIPESPNADAYRGLVYNIQE
ncbi:MAG: DUF4373 domain-containing protein [Ruminococcus sp.]|nr:DUF4373 domain-containing protein [Ruminococcus sp.]